MIRERCPQPLLSTPALHSHPSAIRLGPPSGCRTPRPRPATDCRPGGPPAGHHPACPAARAHGSSHRRQATTRITSLAQAILTLHLTQTEDGKPSLLTLRQATFTFFCTPDRAARKPTRAPDRHHPRTQSDITGHCRETTRRDKETCPFLPARYDSGATLDALMDHGTAYLAILKQGE